MKIYIAGEIPSINNDDVFVQFKNMESLLSAIGFEVVNPIKSDFGVLIKRIELLLTCDSVCMLDSWKDSLFACIEYDIACRMGMDVWFESNIIRNRNQVNEIKDAIREVTGLSFDEYTTKSRKREGFYARMIFVHHCHRFNMKSKTIATHINRHYTSLTHMSHTYNNEVRYNSKFREMAEKVNNILTKQNA